MLSTLNNPIPFTIALFSGAAVGALLASIVCTPFSSALVRYRADYRPLVVQLDAEGNQNQPGARAKGYFGTMGRIYKLEGFAGLYRGFIPILLAMIMISGILASSFRVGTKDTPITVVSQFGLSGSIIVVFISFIIGIPFQIITNRAMVTPYRLPSSPTGIGKTMRVLFTPYERSHPWMLYLAPGVLFSLGLQVALTVTTLTLAQFIIASELKGFSRLASMATAMLFLVICVLNFGIAAPLHVTFVRLTIQRNHWNAHVRANVIEGERDGLVTEAEEAERNGLKEFGSSEDVIALRDETDPYTGLYNCASRMWKEEGWRSLWRGWWITLLSQIAFGA